MPRKMCGVICHPTSMPGRFGIGELGASMFRFCDFLAEAGQSIWQVLPLGPTGYGDSPYQPFSAFAGNPLLIDLKQLIGQGLLREEDVAQRPDLDADQVLYGPVIEFKNRVLRCSFQTAQQRPSIYSALESFRADQSSWLEDYALFMALKLRFNWAVWSDWEPGIALRDARALEYWRNELRDEVTYQCYLQFLFAEQWGRVKSYANERGIRIMGDAPIFVGHDSADVWSHRELFSLDEKGLPTVVAGVPPDYFSATGQLWGNPHYRWAVMRADGYAWWVARLKRVLSQVDMVRLDHFRGFSGYWEVPAGEPTAINGRWVKGPGEDFFYTVGKALGELPIIAEDLGLISADVDALRRQFHFPGMKVLQFAFDSDASNVHLPHNYSADCVAYTGTHDNDTTLGWYASREEKVRHKARVYTGSDGNGMNWALIRLALTSVADIAMYPLQDVLGLGSEARLNTPGRPHSNWTWRYRDEMLRPELAAALRELAYLSGRWLPKGEALPEEGLVTLHYQEPR